MKVLGISVGRKLSNTEVLVKEALKGAEEAGAEVEFIRLHDYNIKPCTGCNACVMSLFAQGGTGSCTIKDDDFAKIDDKIMECDGLIVGSPIYEKSPSGLLKNLNDRMGPSHDMAFRMTAKKVREAKGLTEGGPDERAFKHRAAALIAVGGSEWDQLALPMLHLFTLSMHMDIVDKMLVNWVALPGAMLFQEKAIARAHQDGIQVVKQLQNPDEDCYIGEPGVCPLCHSKLIEVREGDKDYPAVCATCGVRGTLSVEDGHVKFSVSEEDKVHSHVLMSGKFEHVEELQQHSLKQTFTPAEKAERIKPYKEYLADVKQA